MKIYKYPAPVLDNLTIRMPMWSRVLTVQVQNGQPYIWAMVDPTQPPVDFPFVVVGTGHETDIETEKYIGTIQLSDMNLVFHYFRG